VFSDKRGFFYTFPTAEGNDYYLSLRVDEASGPPVIRTPLRLHKVGRSEEVPEFREPEYKLPRNFLGAPDPEDLESVTAASRIHLWPTAGLLAILPSTNQTIALYKVDLPSELKK
jgi:hypothetical protein